MLKTINYIFVNNLVLVAMKYLEEPIAIRPVNRAVVFNFSNCHFDLAYVSFIISEEGWVCSSTNNFPIFEGGTISVTAS